MPMLPDARFEDPFLNDAFDFSRYPTVRTSLAKPSTRHPNRERVALFSYSDHESPSIGTQHPRNVSEPQLISSSNGTRESWFPNVTSVRTVDDVAHLSVGGDDDVLPVVQPSHSTTVSCTESPDDDRSSWSDVDDDQTQKTFPTVSQDSCNTTVSAHSELEPSEDKNEEDSFYSTDSADQDTHPLLLSMPIIPKIKLERKATVRKPDPGPSFHNQSFLSPRIRDLKAPGRMSSRRYGRIIARISPQTGIFDATLASHGEVPRGSGSELAFIRSVSEPMLNSAYTLDDEKEPLLKKSIDEAVSCPGSRGDPVESGTIDEVHRPKRGSLEYSKRSHRRSCMSHSISFSSIIHAITGGCASLDLFLRKPKTKSKSTTKPEGDAHVPHAHDPTLTWAPKQGQIVIKVFVPSTDDIWVFRVPQDISLTDFTSRVVRKIGFCVSFSGSVWDDPKYYFRTDERFRSWVKGRIRFGRNLPIVAHLPPALPLVKLSVDGEGCEVWCYAR